MAPNFTQLRAPNFGTQLRDYVNYAPRCPAIFGANRHPTESLLSLRLSGLTMKRSVCKPGP
jgi:hypothetical protein